MSLSMSSLSTLKKGLSPWACHLDHLAGRAFLGWVVLHVSVPCRPGETGWSLAAVRVCVGYAIRGDRDGVVVKHMDSCVPWVDLGLSWTDLEGRVD
jgi:hypothetical protein